MQTPMGCNNGYGCPARRSLRGLRGHVALAVLLSTAAATANAVEPATGPASAETTAGYATPDPAPSGIPGIPGIGQPIDAGRLDGLRGGDGSTSNHVDVDGEVSGNSADNITSGMNLVDGGSFGNAAGVSTVIQNSGSNVLIQNAMIVNVQFADPSP